MLAGIWPSGVTTPKRVPDIKARRLCSRHKHTPQAHPRTHFRQSHSYLFEMAPTTVAVIGATGILGTHITHGLLDNGNYTVTVLTRKVGAPDRSIQHVYLHASTLLNQHLLDDGLWSTSQRENMPCIFASAPTLFPHSSSLTCLLWPNPIHAPASGLLLSGRRCFQGGPLHLQGCQSCLC